MNPIHASAVLPELPLRIVADENIPYVKEFFSDFGVIVTLPGRAMTAADVAQADVLLVRSVTPVDESLLQGSRVKFVGTCTIGVDHLDVDYLRNAGITYSSAPGCNANSVVEYVFSVLAQLRPDWLQRSFGIIGCGNVGGALYQRLKTLGLKVSYYDPLLCSTDTDFRQADDQVCLEQVLQADVIAMHAPLTRSGDHPSHHLVSQPQLTQLRTGALLINAGRGAVIDNTALLQTLQQRSDVDVALDVWEWEPFVEPQLLPHIALATPHIAGYSFDGKVEGTAMIYRALCCFLGVKPDRSAQQLLPQEVNVIDNVSGSTQQVLNQAILNGYDVAADDNRMRREIEKVIEANGEQSSRQAIGATFDELRKTYPVRREFFTQHIRVCDEGQREDQEVLSTMLNALGFAPDA